MARNTFSIKSNLEQSAKNLMDLTSKELTKAIRQSMNKTATSMRTESGRIIREKIKIKARAINNRTTVIRTRASSINNMEAGIDLRNKPMGLINFLKGKNQVTSRVGIARSKRKAVRIEIKKGKVVKLKKAFIARARGKGKKQIFIREGAKALPIIRPAVPVFDIVYGQGKPNMERLIVKSLARFDKEFDRAFDLAKSKTLKKKGQMK